MYIELTTRCNMRCAHCLSACTSKGIDMDFNTFLEAMQLAERFGEMVTLGGGEPTLWKHFPQMMDWLEQEIWYDSYIEHILIVTNGTRVRNTMRAVKLMERVEEFGHNTEFQVILSAHDGYHDDSKIHPKVYDYFAARERSVRREAIRSVRRIIAQGRGKDIAGAEEDCACPTLTVKADGRVKWCGCPDAPELARLPRLMDDLPENFNSECWKDAEPIVNDEEKEEAA